jgi:3',5'-cyclic-AMP phosphodiesterase
MLTSVLGAAPGRVPGGPSPFRILGPMEDPRPELMTLADDHAVVFRGAQRTVYDDLAQGTEVDLDGHVVRTLPRRGELLARVTTVNDVHFGEVVCGHVDGVDEWETFSVGPGERPYPETMSAGAVTEMLAVDPDAVVVKGDLTSKGTQAEYDRFREVYAPLGDRLLHVRGNHESYHSLQAAAWPTQERVLPGVTLAVLDTSGDGRVNGNLTADQLGWLDELAARADRPVLVFGHHPVWNPAEERRHDGTFGLVPTATEALAEVFARRPALLGYFACHTHRNKVVGLPDAPGGVFAEVACVKDYPGSWAEYRVFDGLVLQVHHRISTPEALAWTERTRGMFGGTYPAYARGRLADRCFAMDATDRQG